MIRFEGFSSYFLRGLSDMAQGQLASQTFQVPDTVEAIEFYFEQGLTDGLPVVPPTPDMVARFLDAIGKAPGDVLGTIPTRKREITAEKVAINAIMAGCKPEYMPVVATAISAMCEEKFNLHGTSASTAGTGHMVLVHGPIVKELDINYANNLFGPTKRSNATIGRAIRLIIMNVCGSVPGILDKSTFGHPGKYSYCFAENEELSPWAPAPRGARAVAGVERRYRNGRQCSHPGQRSRQPHRRGHPELPGRGNPGQRDAERRRANGGDQPRGTAPHS